MKTQQRIGFEPRVPGPLRSSAAQGMRAAWICVALALAACGASSGKNEEPRYPEKRRPPPARSASDGEVLGAHGQSPEDTLEGSPTNLHPAPGWEGEKGAMERAKEKEATDCDPEAPKAKNASASTEANATEANASAPNGRPRSNKPCPKPAAR